MKNVESKAATSTKEVPEVIYNYDTSNMFELNFFLKSLLINFRDQSSENTRLICVITNLKKMNNHSLCLKFKGM